LWGGGGVRIAVVLLRLKLNGFGLIGVKFLFKKSMIKEVLRGQGAEIAFVSEQVVAGKSIRSRRVS
jgi:hypothetical protein